jgi:uncharacterized protein involved in outer membrane biogenesis
MLRVLGTIIGVILIVIVVAVVSGVAALLRTDWDGLRSPLQTAATAAAGRDVTIAGDIALHDLRPLTMTVHDVRVANIDAGSRPDMARIDRLTVQVKTRPLLSGSVELTEVRVGGADILLERAGGRANWSFGQKAQAKGGMTVPPLRQVAVDDSQLTYQSAGGTAWDARVTTLQLAAESPTDPLSVTLDGSIRDLPMTLDGTLGTLQGLRTNAADWPVDLTLSLGEARLSADGTISRPQTLESYTLNTKIDLPSPRPIASLMGAPGTQELSGLAAVAGTATLRDEDGRIGVPEFQATVGSSELSGDLMIGLSGNRPSVSGSLQAARLDPADFGAGPGGGGADAKENGDTGGGLIPDTPVPYSMLQAAQADLDVAIDTLVVGPRQVQDVQGHLGLQDGRLTVDLAQAKALQGSLSGTVTADSTTSPGSVSVDMTADQIALAALLAGGGQSGNLVQGPLDIETALRGRGATVRSLVASSDGRVEIVMDSGRINNLVVDIVGEGLINALMPNIGARSENVIRCAVARFDVADGIAESTALLLAMPKLTIGGRGAVDLGKARIDFLLRPETEDPSLVSLVAPVRIHGPVSNISVNLQTGGESAAALMGTTDPASLSVPVVGAGTGEGNSCLTALSAPGTGQGTAQETEQEAGQEAGQGTGAAGAKQQTEGSAED